MTIRVSAIRVSVIAATLSMSVLAPLAAQAAGGTIRFVGAIVEHTRCQVLAPGSTMRVAPQVSCVGQAGRPALINDNVVKVSTRTLPAAPSVNGGPAQQRRLVTLEYL